MAINKKDPASSWPQKVTEQHFGKEWDFSNYPVFAMLRKFNIDPDEMKGVIVHSMMKPLVNESRNLSG